MIHWSAPAENKPSVSPRAALLCRECDSPQVYLSAWYMLIVACLCVTLLGCYRWTSPMWRTLRLSPPVSICAQVWRRRTGDKRTQSEHSQWVCHRENTPWLKKAQLWLPLHGWCGLMMAHPWLGDENLMNCQEQNSFKREIDTSGLHIGNITDASVCLAISAQVVTWWLLCVSFWTYSTAQHL